MAWRGLHLSQPARLSLADGQILIAREGEDLHLALEDIAWIVIDSPQVSLTTKLLSACMAAGIVITLTDETHTPSGMMLPFHRHFRQGEIARLQAALGHSLKGRLWQAIVRRKIANQALVLEIAGRPGARAIAAMARHVRQGDPANVEARAARDYFRAMFDDFRRGDAADRRNAMLNYGYAIVRSALARSLVAAGLLPALGVKHDSATNGFNLADDLVEPFRPVVDLAVVELVARGGAPEREAGMLDLATRRELATLPLRTVCLAAERLTLLVAAERAAQSFVRALEAGLPAALELPEPDRGSGPAQAP